MSSSRSQNRPVRSSKRRRRTPADASAATRDDPSPWESLHEDLLELIAWRVLAGDGDLLDYVRFRAVCPHWRSSTACPRGRGIVDRRFHPRRWMLLPKGHGLYPGHGKLRGFVRFFNLSTGAFVRVHLPLFRDHCVLDSVDGILLLRRDHDTAIRLLHPFTGDILDFPPLETLRRYVSSKLVGDKWDYIRRIGAASISVSADQVVSLMMWSPGMVQVAFATSGEQQWRASSWYFNQIFSPLAFQGKLYMVRHHLTYGEPEILQIDPPQLEGTEFWLPPPTLIAKCPANTANTSGSRFSYHLVECDSEVLVIALSTGIHRKISVYRLADFMLGRRTLRVTCIGGNALFIGKRNLCVSSKAFPTVVGDTIVFHHYQQGYLAQYHLAAAHYYQHQMERLQNMLYQALVPSFTISTHVAFVNNGRNKGHIRFQGLLTINWRVKRKWRSGA
uniref:KIB1-4 beta-propeller domain-containing protein n=1 Tax=Oryza meridionalis TaxID=40149 RepID=A0A0E0CU17_9ORYZ